MLAKSKQETCKFFPDIMIEWLVLLLQMQKIFKKSI